MKEKNDDLITLSVIMLGDIFNYLKETAPEDSQEITLFIEIIAGLNAVISYHKKYHKTMALKRLEKAYDKYNNDIEEQD